jgi:hypothetical protein
MIAEVSAEGRKPRGRNSALRWALPGFLLAFGTSLVMLIALLETEGWRVALPLSVPIALTGAGVAAARVRARSALVMLAMLLGAGIVIGAASIGLFYLPAEMALIVAAVKAGRS